MATHKGGHVIMVAADRSSSSADTGATCESVLLPGLVGLSAARIVATYASTRAKGRKYI